MRLCVLSRNNRYVRMKARLQAWIPQQIHVIFRRQSDIQINILTSGMRLHMAAEPHSCLIGGKCPITDKTRFIVAALSNELHILRIVINRHYSDYIGYISNLICVFVIDIAWFSEKHIRYSYNSLSNGCTTGYPKMLCTIHNCINCENIVKCSNGQCCNIILFIQIQQGNDVTTSCTNEDSNSNPRFPWSPRKRPGRWCRNKFS